jgi:hypothetical protein
MARLSPYPVWTILDDNGRTIPGALLYTYAAGTTTPKASYTDHTGDTANPNPIVADSAARLCIWLGSGNYKLMLTDGENATLFDPDTPEGNLIWTKDYINGSQGGVGDYLSVRTIPELRTVTGYEADQIIHVQGHTAQDDGGGGWFWFDGTATDDDDNGIKILPDDLPASGRWIRLVYGPIDVKWYGAGYSDDDAAFQATVDYAGGAGADVLVSHGDYNINLTVNINNPVKIKGENATIIRGTNFLTSAFSSDSVAGIEISDLKFSQGRIVDFEGCTDVKVLNCYQNGQFVSGNSIAVCPINILGCSKVEIAGNTLINNDGHITIDSSDGLETGSYSDYVDIHDNVVYNTYHGHDRAYCNGIYINYVGAARVHGNTVSNILSGTASPVPGKVGCGIYEGDGVCSTLQVTDNLVTNTTTDEKWQGITSKNATDVAIADNIIKFAGTPTITTMLGINVASTADRISITGNTVNGVPIFVSPSTGDARVLCNSNIVKGCFGVGIYVYTAATGSLISVEIVGNVLVTTGHSGISINNITDSHIANNEIIDANANDSTDNATRSAIFFWNSFQATVLGNKIQNNQLGHARYGIDFNYNGPLSKWQYSDNVFHNMETGNYLSAYSAFPVGDLWDIGDRVGNVINGNQIASHFELISTHSDVLRLQAGLYSQELYMDYDTACNIQPGDILKVPMTNGQDHWTTVIGLTNNGTDDTPNYTLYLESALQGVAEIGDPVYSYRWKNSEPQTAELFVLGVSEIGDEREVRVNGRLILQGGFTSSNTRGLMMTTFDKDTMDVVRMQNYDLDLDSAYSDTLANDLELLEPTELAVLCSQGAWNENITADLKTAALKLGLFKLYTAPTTAQAMSYAAVLLGCHSTTAHTNRSVIEILQDGTYAGNPRAIISTTVYKGGFPGSAPPTALISGNPGSQADPLIYVGGDGILYTPGRSTGTQIDFTVPGSDITLPTTGNVFRLVYDGHYQIDRIDVTGWTNGSRILLIADETGNIQINWKNDQTTVGTFAPIKAWNVTNPDGGSIAPGWAIPLCLVKTDKAQCWILEAGRAEI